jgi:hypothetical protein
MVLKGVMRISIPPGVYVILFEHAGPAAEAWGF